MSRVRVKFCGITRPQDAVVAAELGVDAIGLVFVPGSKRRVDLTQARAILDALPPLVTSVALFMDASAEEVRAVLDALPIDLTQFHGRETPEYCESVGRPYIKALAMGDTLDAVVEAGRYARARGVLLDAHRKGELGGRGERFDWQRIPPALAARILLAGGLDETNVAEAVRQVRPYAVDVSTGIESSPGIKCARRMQKFIEEVNRASREHGQR
jgi:phosphoribosylanthranilate isomerase